MRTLTLGARPDFEINRITLRPIDEVVTVGDAGLEARSVARSQYGRAALLDQRDLDLEHVNELMLGLGPMAQRRGGARLEPGDIHPELREAHTVAGRRFLSALGDCAPWIRIAGLGTHRRYGDVYLRHSAPPCAPQPSIGSPDLRK